MKTIEERAEYYERRCAYVKSLGWDVPRPSENYEQGAYDRRKIDIDKVCEWFEKYLTERYLAGMCNPDDWRRAARRSRVAKRGLEKQWRNRHESKNSKKGA